MMKFDMATYCPDWQLSAFRDVPVIQFFRAVHCTEDQHIVQCPPTIQIFVAMLCPDRQVSIVCGVQEILFYMAMRISCPDSHARFLKRPADAALRGQMPLQFCQRSLCDTAVWAPRAEAVVRDCCKLSVCFGRQPCGKNKNKSQQQINHINYAHLEVQRRIDENCSKLVSWLVRALSPVNPKGLYQSWKKNFGPSPSYSSHK